MLTCLEGISPSDFSEVVLNDGSSLPIDRTGTPSLGIAGGFASFQPSDTDLHLDFSKGVKTYDGHRFITSPPLDHAGFLTAQRQAYQSPL